MKEIKLTQGFVALVDDEDYKELNQFKWHVTKIGRTYYAVRNNRISKGKREILRMHRIILGVTDRKIKIDHKDNNGLNNQNENLRLASQAQNCRNKVLRIGTSSKYKGVSKHQGKYQANIGFNYKLIYLGIYDNEIDAAIAYNNKAAELFGEFAKLNIIKQ